MFRCKQFSVAQDKCAMKVNTDSLILGSWTNTNNAKRILDIGTGSGILALMLAQKSSQETTVDAIEIDDSAAAQASQNFAHAPWSNRMQVVHTDLAHFQPSHLYDLIITNPPYFDSAKSATNAYCAQTSARAVARQVSRLEPVDLFQFCSEYLVDTGSMYCVYPYASAKKIIYLAGEQGLYLTRIINIRHSATREPYLSAFQFRLQPSDKVLSDTLTIRDQESAYTDQFRALCKAYYLKF
jgi:tRNA1Val (adenine37-N6)-methyltransferase